MALGAGIKPSSISVCLANFTSDEVFLFCGFGREPVTRPGVGTGDSLWQNPAVGLGALGEEGVPVAPSLSLERSSCELCPGGSGALEVVDFIPQLPSPGGAVLEEGEITAPPGTLPALERLQRLWDVPGAHGMKTNRARGSWAGSEIQGIAGGKDPTRRKGCR